MGLDKLPEDVQKALAGSKIFPVGSRTIFQGFRDDSDWDFLVFNRLPMPELMDQLGYKLERGGTHYEPSKGNFNSWRKDEINIILTHDRYFAQRFLHANNIAKTLGLTRRDDRVSLFKGMLYGVGQVSIDSYSECDFKFESEDGIPW